MIMLFGVIIGIIYGIGQLIGGEDGNISVTGIVFLDVIIMLVFGMGGASGIAMGAVICIFSDIIIIDGLQESSSTVAYRQQKQKEYENNYGTISWKDKDR